VYSRCSLYSVWSCGDIEEDCGSIAGLRARLFAAKTRRSLLTKAVGELTRGPVLFSFGPRAPRQKRLVRNFEESSNFERSSAIPEVLRHAPRVINPIDFCFRSFISLH